VKMEKFPDPTKPVYAPRDRRKEARYRTTMRNPTNPREYLPPATTDRPTGTYQPGYPFGGGGGSGDKGGDVSP